MGLEPKLGRGFSAEETVVGHPRDVAVIGHRLWRQQFGADPAAIGRTILVDDRPTVIVGVMSPGEQWFDADLVMPLPPYVTNMPDRRMLVVVGRLKPGQTIEAAQSPVAGHRGGCASGVSGCAIGYDGHPGPVRRAGGRRRHTADPGAAQRCGRACLAHRLREPGAPVAGARRRTPARDRDSNGHRRRALPCHAATPDRVDHACRSRRRPGRLAGALGGGCAPRRRRRPHPAAGCRGDLWRNASVYRRARAHHGSGDRVAARDPGVAAENQ